MGRRRTIDRDQLLDAAEAVIGREGAAGLTIDAVAKEMGITKGGVQYCFGTKDALIDAIFERWGKAYDSLFEAVAGKQPTPLTRVRAHAEATQRSDELSSSKAAALMAALIQTPEHLEGSNQWYRSRLEGLDLSAPEGRRARLAFLAVEGAFMLRYFRLMDIDQEEWDSMLDDVRALLLTPAGATGD
ncbi:TetR/AcrR family transcriptional regulator [Pseudomonas aeruginosa]|uniref:TetR/AcrR family transcriptional regulator n=1 Tax=Pseudomonas aeruginosa TaxID=287 RepID=UPI0015E73D1F|nr:TetR/AcrR family transcriptional regulator [Pseudomonas aeruginosa]